MQSAVSSPSRRAALALALLLGWRVPVPGAAFAAPQAAPAAAGAATTAPAPHVGLVVVHTNDSHSHLLPEAASWRDDHPMVGGVVALEALVRSLRPPHGRWENVLVLDAGDILTGTPLCELERDGLTGAPVVDLLDRVGYDAGTIGNHEFDHGAGALDRLIARTKHRRLLCANLFHPDGTPYAPEPGHVFQFPGLSVGVVGLITEDLPSLLTEENLRACRVTSAAQAAQQWIQSLPHRPDLLIAVTHLGVEADEQLARDVPALDLIVGGHSHTRLVKPRKVGTTTIVQTGGELREAGLVRIELEAGKLVSIDTELQTLFAQNIHQNPDLAKTMAGYAKQIEGAYGVKIADLETAWVRESGRDSNVGNWICDQLADAEGVDFGLMNSGGIRANVPAGPLTREHIVQVLPFSNEVVTFQTTGEELRRILLHNAELAQQDNKGVVQLGHIRACWRATPQGLELVDPTVRGAPLDPARTYTGASVDFVVYAQAETYLGLVPRERRRTGELISSVIEQCARKAKVVRAEADGRFTEVK